MYDHPKGSDMVMIRTYIAHSMHMGCVLCPYVPSLIQMH